MDAVVNFRQIPQKETDPVIFRGRWGMDSDKFHKLMTLETVRTLPVETGDIRCR